MTDPVPGGLTVKRWWWAPVTVLITTAGGGFLLIVEALFLGLSRNSPGFGTFLLAVTIPGLRRHARRYVDRANPYWEGVWYGFLVAVATPVAAGVLLASSWGEIVPAIGGSMWLVAVSFEFPLMCLIGGLAWAVLSRKRPRHGTVEIGHYRSACPLRYTTRIRQTNPETSSWSRTYSVKGTHTSTGQPLPRPTLSLSPQEPRGWSTATERRLRRRCRPRSMASRSGMGYRTYVEILQCRPGSRGCGVLSRQPILGSWCCSG